MLFWMAASVSAADRDTAGARVPVLLELFTSEGCSSCPPADKLLADLDRLQPVAGAELVVLGEHVDYFNQLGWKDRFSSAQFTARQQDYADRLHLDGPYTPQLIVDGQAQMVGSDSRGALSAVQQALKAPKIPITIAGAERLENQVSARIAVSAAAKKRLRLWVALVEEQADSQVTRGENAGRSLSHVAEALALRDMGAIRLEEPVAREVTLPLETGSGAHGLRLIVFVQDPGPGRIEGVALRRF
jgi:hypothetical protein